MTNIERNIVADREIDLTGIHIVDVKGAVTDKGVVTDQEVVIGNEVIQGHGILKTIDDEMIEMIVNGLECPGDWLTIDDKKLCHILYLVLPVQSNQFFSNVLP